MSLDRLRKCFRVAIAVHNRCGGKPISVLIVKDIVKEIFEVSSFQAVENNLNYLIAKKFLTSNIGMVSAQKDIEEVYEKFKQKWGL